MSVIETLVAACESLGRSAISTARVRDLVRATDGVSSEALDSDAAVLADAAAAAREALATARSASGLLAQAWLSGSGSAATGFLDRQCAAGSAVTDALAGSAGTLRQLREELSHLTRLRDQATARVDAQVPAGWLTAAQAVASGRANDDAVTIVTGSVAPFVDTAIAGQWVPAMASVAADADAAYRRAAAALDDHAPARFETPAMPSAAAPVQPAAVTLPSPGTDTAAASALPEFPASGGFPAGGAIPSLPDIGGGLLALVNAIAAALDAVEPSVEPGSTGPAEPENKPQDTEPEPVKESKKAPEIARPEPEELAPAVTSAPVPPAPLPAPLAAEAPEPPPPAAPERTPCEIAADELPQVGA